MGAAFSAHVFDFIQSLDGMDSPDAVNLAFRVLIGLFGFSFYCLGSMKPMSGERGLVWTASRQHAWFKHWVRQEYYNTDPVMWQLERYPAPFRWKTVRQRGEAPDGLGIWDEASEFAIRDGWAMGFRFTDPEAPTVAVSLGTDHYDLGPDDETSLHLATVYASLRLAALGYPRLLRCSPLTQRERECLKWVAAGKTDWEISEILQISQQTAHKHVSNALLKLNCGSRAHAVSVALLSGQISI